MKNYLESKLGKKIGVIRVGMPKEVYFEGVVKEVTGDTVILEGDNGAEFALPMEKILLVGQDTDKEKSRAGF